MVLLKDYIETIDTVVSDARLPVDKAAYSEFDHRSILKGIRLIATCDDQISVEDFRKIAELIENGVYNDE